jgi:hypothetical protein
MDYCISHGIKRQFFIARTPQQNGVVERKNETIQEMAQTMLMDSKLKNIFWTRAMHTTVHIQNTVMFINNTEKKSLRAMERKTRKCEALNSFWK